MCASKTVALYFLPIKTRVPLKFGPEVTTSVTVARVRIEVESAGGKRATRLGRNATECAMGLAKHDFLRRTAFRAERIHDPTRGIVESFRCQRDGV